MARDTHVLREASCARPTTLVLARSNNKRLHNRKSPHTHNPSKRGTPLWGFRFGARCGGYSPIIAINHYLRATLQFGIRLRAARRHCVQHVMRRAAKGKKDKPGKVGERCKAKPTPNPALAPFAVSFAEQVSRVFVAALQHATRLSEDAAATFPLRVKLAYSAPFPRVTALFDLLQHAR